MNRHDRLTAKVVDGRKFEVIPGISQRRQELQVEVEQLARPLFFVAAGFRPRGAHQPIRAGALEDALRPRVEGIVDRMPEPRQPLARVVDLAGQARRDRAGRLARLDLRLSGDEQVRFEFRTKKGSAFIHKSAYEGIIPNLERRYRETASEGMRGERAWGPRSRYTAARSGKARVTAAVRLETCSRV